MSYYAIKNRKSGKLLSVMPSMTIADMAHPPITASETHFCATPALQIGEYLTEPLFMTADVDLAKLLCISTVGNARSYILLNVPFQAELSDLVIIDLATEAEVPLEPYSEELQQALATPYYRDVRTDKTHA